VATTITVRKSASGRGEECSIMADFEGETLRVEQRPDGIALLRVDVPDRPVNVFTRQVFTDLQAALQVVEAEPGIRLLVIRSNKTSGFMVGADIKEFAEVRTPEDAQTLTAVGQEAFNRLADLRVPTVALIHGPCLGGGLEFALACDYRLVLDHPKTQFGFPEIELGVLPGWGGTQRFPRVVGLERALQGILTARRLTAQQAARWGLADALAQSEAELAAKLNLLIDRALKQGKRPKKGLPLRTWRQRFLESTPAGRWLIFRGTERVLRRRVPEDMPAPGEALRAVRVGLTQGMTAGLAAEREGAGRLATSTAAHNLVNLFFQRERAHKLPEELLGGAPEAIRKVAVVGAGAMGAGIAQLAAIRGCELTVQEVNDGALAAGMQKISALFDKAVANRVLTEEAAQKNLTAIRRTTTWEGLEQADLVVEAVIEELELKRSVFRELERRTRPSAILATNTSSLSVTQIQDQLEHPERVAGLHFFNPVHKMPLVEVVRAPATSEQTVATLAQWAVALGKTPVIVKDSPGFVVNRILMPYLLEAVVLAAQGVPIERLDKTMRRFGMPMGPFELLDQVGLDVAAYVGQAVQPVFGERLGASSGLQEMAKTFERMREKGWLGQKSGQGFYRYQRKAKKVHRGAVDLLPSDTNSDAGRLLQSLPPAAQMREARDRMVLLMVNEANACLAEGLAADADMIDLAMVMGTGWAPHRGGPIRYGLDRGLPEVVKKLSELAQRVGPRFEPCAALKGTVNECQQL
jgi:3-hydroxyacyl-CoA dehydrogenase/enoyl-CoA hydratase/3-hydroxybutyryl-CoA epimerase